MKVKSNKYTFRQVDSSDLNTLSLWLQEPMVARWFDDPDYINSLEKQLKDSRIRMQLVLLDETPIAYVQDYDIHGWSQHHLAYLPVNSRGIDTFIGSVELIGKGHGASYLSLLCAHLFLEGVPALGIDPHPDNIQARRAYQKIGFTEDGEIESSWGEVVLMSLLRPQVQKATVIQPESM